MRRSESEQPPTAPVSGETRTEMAIESGRARCRGRRGRKSAPDWLKFMLMMMAGVLASGAGARAQDVWSCCDKAEGSCRSVCEKMSLAEVAADGAGATREDRMHNIYKFCSPALIEFWICMNATIQEVMAGDGWWGRACCSAARGAECRHACATGSDARAAAAACRRSDELAFFDCVQRQRDAQDCCSHTQSVACHEACRDALWSTLRDADVGAARARALAACEASAAVAQCVRNLTRISTPTDPLKYLSCCQQSERAGCREACERVLGGSGAEYERDPLEALVGAGCGKPLPQDAFWQCILRADSQVARPAHRAAVDRLGIDAAKLHCCHKGVSAACRRLCSGTYDRDWLQSRPAFEAECLNSAAEPELTSCLQEVEEPCRLGCEGLTYCTNYNGRPTELFRSCTTAADLAAHLHVNTQLARGSLRLGDLQLPVHNSSRCSPELWRAVACVLHVKPCVPSTHSSRLCREDCLRLVSECVRWDAVRALASPDASTATAPQLCRTISHDDDTPCIHLSDYLAPPSITGGEVSPGEGVTTPCAGAPCGAVQTCAVNRSCARGLSCAPYTCLAACPVGEASELTVPVGTYVRVPQGGATAGYVKVCVCGADVSLERCEASELTVPVGTYVRVPLGGAAAGCVKICVCGAGGSLERCQPLPCVRYDDCKLLDEAVPHGNTYYMECNECKCYAGERVCSKRACADDGGGGAALLTRLPCNCPTHHLPVCVAGRTLASACIARCNGYGDSEIVSGACAERDACAGVACAAGRTCVPRPTVCLSLLQTPCLQYQCVKSAMCNDEREEPACDTSGATHVSLCTLLASGRRLAYRGPCLDNARTEAAGSVCGADGATYESVWAAAAAAISVDYSGKCVAVGAISSDSRARCSLERVTCPPLARTDCRAFTAPGACCARCGGALRVLYSRKQVDRALYALRARGGSVGGGGGGEEVLSVRGVVGALARQVGVAECAVRGHLTVEMELFVSVESAVESPSALQTRACELEAERLATLINTESARFAAELPLSLLLLAIPLHAPVTSSALVAASPSLGVAALLALAAVAGLAAS